MPLLMDSKPVRRLSRLALTLTSAVAITVLGAGPVLAAKKVDLPKGAITRPRSLIVAASGQS